MCLLQVMNAIAREAGLGDLGAAAQSLNAYRGPSGRLRSAQTLPHGVRPRPGALELSSLRLSGFFMQELDDLAGLSLSCPVQVPMQSTSVELRWHD